MLAAITLAGACRRATEGTPLPQSEGPNVSQQQAAASAAERRPTPAGSDQKTVTAAAPAHDPFAVPDTAAATEPAPAVKGHPSEPVELEGPAEQATPDLGPPLVDDPQQLQRLNPKFPVWITKDRKSVVLVGEVCQREAPLELFACKRGSKEHESIVVVDAEPYIVHAGLLATGAEPGNPVQYHPKFIPAKGPQVEVTVRWKDEKGKVQDAPAQSWVRQMKTGKAMEYPWVFAGSRFVKNEETGQQRYLADIEGDVICVSNFPDAVLDLPVQSSDSNDLLMFQAFTERIPPLGTPVTLMLTPKK